MACNDFGGPVHTEQQIREALDLSAEVPLMECDARDRASSKYVLITLVEYLRTLSVSARNAAEAAQAAGTAQTTPESAP